MFNILVVYHVLVCIGLILVVLLQSSKGEGLAGSAFGGNISGAVFGGRGAATFLSKATSVLAIMFMLNCISLAYMSAGTRVVSDGSTPATSITTEKAQEDRERALQQQQLQDTQSGDTTSAINIIDNNAAPVDTSGQ